ncbi:MAG: FMN-binding protein [Lachnospiraceae bacterium]|jgi:major membrane immunogen (membrane-anchored lipoprotein)|nr:FMN-binding protein [Lachnospiraceae bacterium]
MRKYICLLLFFLVLFLGGCGRNDKMKDGFYTAEMSDYSHGWKEYLCIMVKDGIIVYAEFNAKNQSGYIKAWDNAYMQNMVSVSGTYPNEYTRNYVAQLIEVQNPKNIDAISGASNSGSNFIKLATAVINQAIEGDAATIVVK